ncbi:hypothetical protein GCM10020331_034780 [Ectobacillus funiculus]
MEGENKRNPVASMPGVEQVSLDLLNAEIQEAVDLGIKSIIVFGIPHEKDEVGSSAYCDHGIVQKGNCPGEGAISRACCHCGYVPMSIYKPWSLRRH